MKLLGELNLLYKRKDSVSCLLIPIVVLAFILRMYNLGDESSLSDESNDEPSCVIKKIIDSEVKK